MRERKIIPEKRPVLKPISVLAFRFEEWKKGEGFSPDRSQASLYFQWLDNGGIDSVATEERLEEMAIYLLIDPVPLFSDYRAWGSAEHFDFWIKNTDEQLTGGDSDKFIKWLRQNPNTKTLFNTYLDLLKTVEVLNRKDMGFGYQIVPPSEDQFKTLKDEPETVDLRTKRFKKLRIPLAAKSFFTSSDKNENSAPLKQIKNERGPKASLSPDITYYYPSEVNELPPLSSLSGCTDEAYIVKTLALSFHYWKHVPRRPAQNKMLPPLVEGDAKNILTWIRTEKDVKEQIKTQERLMRVVVFLNDRILNSRDEHIYLFYTPKESEFLEALRDVSQNAVVPQPVPNGHPAL